MNTWTTTSKPRSRGFALVGALTFLLILTILGVAMLSTNMSQEKMTYAVADYNRAFQAADSAVVQGESWLNSLSAQPTAMQSCGSSCTVTVWQLDYPLQTYTTTGSWADFNWGLARDFSKQYDALGAATDRTDTDVNPVMLRTQTPLYVIEEVGPDRQSSLALGQGRTVRRYYYRITARGHGYGGYAYAQSSYVKTY